MVPRHYVSFKKQLTGVHSMKLHTHSDFVKPAACHSLVGITPG